MWPIIEWKFYKNLYSRSMRSHWVFKCCAINNCALVEIFAEEGLFCFAFMWRNAGRKSNDLDFRRLVLVWSLKLLQAFGGFTSSSLAVYNPEIKNLFSMRSMQLWEFPNIPTYTSQTLAKAQKISLLTFSWKFKVYRRLYSRDPLSLNRAISLVEILRNASLHFRAVGKREGRSPLRVLQIRYSYLS